MIALPKLYLSCLTDTQRVTVVETQGDKWVTLPLH